MSPPGLSGDVSLIRVGSSAVGSGAAYACPLQRSVKARPALKAAAKPKVEEPPMALGHVMDVLDRVESGESVEAAVTSVRGAVFWHEGLTSYVTSAVQAYLSATDSSQDLVPVRQWWVVQHRDDVVRELWAWGRRYSSPDGSRRELRFLRFGWADPQRRNAAEVAVAAYVAAYGRPAQWPDPWERHFAVGGQPQVSNVVVAEVSLADGVRSVLFDGTAAEASGLYAQTGQLPVAKSVDGTSRRAGGDCLKCRLLAVCPEVPRAPGLLGLPAYPKAKLRSVSVSDLRYHDCCPAQYHLQAMRLPKSNEYSAEARLGLAVHDYLERLHRRHSGPCVAADMPVDASWLGATWALDEQDAMIGAKMLAHHPQVCPIQAGVTDVCVEKTFTFYDTAAQALVIAKADLVHRDGSSWVWRETKTTQRPARGHSVLNVYPQIALATAVLSRGLLGGSVDGSRVEVEVLRPTGADLILVDPSDPTQVAEAHALLGKLTRPWREDSTFPARPGGRCHTCPVRMWCPSSVAAAPPLLEETPCGDNQPPGT
ncbi:PD-(D/E)XK nuclease superfamily protein [Micromonospora cremea]|uniref:PD-(D/E)XK nuclease superfamily protein n=1 Tax=Micromonospora cremea TaxID=709881 RepID=A0A1N5TYE7_9ACTN|nr:PD-(D/E)XK nuclease superfamily protein [Micromonospora cremea]